MSAHQQPYEDPHHYASLWADDTELPHEHPEWQAAYKENLSDLQAEAAQHMPNRNLSQAQFSPMYHGSPYSRQPGDTIDPGHKYLHGMTRQGYTYATYSAQGAARYARGGEYGRAKTGQGHVYEVEPTGEYGTDPGSGGLRSRAPMRIKREIPVDQAKKQRGPAVPRHRPEFIGKDSDYQDDADFFDRKWYGE